MENNSLINMPLILVTQDQDSLAEQAELMQDLQVCGALQLNQPPSPLSPFIEYKNGILTLQMPSGLYLAVDFLEKKYHRTFTPSKDLLCRACGWHLGLKKIWDLTAGLAVDSILLAQAGFEVRALERNKSLIVLLRQAYRTYQTILSMSQQMSPSQKIQYRALNHTSFDWANSDKFLIQSHEEKSLPDVIYYDPMYPAKNKTALPSKEMQVLRELNGMNEEDPEIVINALRLNVKRVVVKRPLKADVLLEKPTFQLSSKLVRYDVYARN